MNFVIWAFILIISQWTTGFNICFGYTALLCAKFHSYRTAWWMIWTTAYSLNLRVEVTRGFHALQQFPGVVDTIVIYGHITFSQLSGILDPLLFLLPSIQQCLEIWNLSFTNFICLPLTAWLSSITNTTVEHESILLLLIKERQKVPGYRQTWQF